MNVCDLELFYFPLDIQIIGFAYIFISEMSIP